jgi:hypothetical protein
MNKRENLTRTNYKDVKNLPQSRQYSAMGAERQLIRAWLTYLGEGLVTAWVRACIGFELVVHTGVLLQGGVLRKSLFTDLTSAQESKKCNSKKY